MKIEPYKQTLTHSCLIACFLMLIKVEKSVKIREKDEHELALKGSSRIYPFYIVGVPMEVSKKFNQKINIFVDNKYFTNVLKKSFNENFNLTYQPITLKFIRNTLKTSPLICHIDGHDLGDYSHFSHFIVLTKASDKFIEYIDPLNGKLAKMTDKKLENAIFSLKSHIKMAPLLFEIPK